MRAAVVMALLVAAQAAHAGPETSLREFNSSQIKKGVRALGMGGDGATIGNYSLVYRDADSALVDYGGAFFSDTGNQIHFVAVGATTPRFWNGAAFYLIAMAAWGSGLKLHLTSPAFPRGADFIGDGSDQALFAKFAKPLGHGVAIGFLLGWERSALTATHGAGGASVAYATTYLPSGGMGVSWDATPWLLVGARVLLNNDWETQTDAVAVRSGWIHSWEARLGVAVRVWRGGIVDTGFVGLWRGAAVAGTSTLEARLVAGFEQTLLDGKLQLRVGWNETSPTAGVSVRVRRLKLDVAYAHDLGVDRTQGVFGKSNSSVLATLTLDYGRKR